MGAMFLFVMIGGLIGLFVAGWSGLVLGAFVGYAAGAFFTRGLVMQGAQAARDQFLVSTFAVMGALCKADGRVSREEIHVAEQLFERLELSADERRAARASFNRGKSADFELEAEVARLRTLIGRNQALMELFIRIQLSAVAADGVVHPGEHDMIVRVARALGLSAADVAHLEALLAGAAAADRRGGEDLAHAYATLGVDAAASDAEIRQAYRRLMSRHHPDKLAARGMPEHMRPIARERTLEIRQAYEAIRARRAA